MRDFIVDIQGFVFPDRPTMVIKAVNVVECTPGGEGIKHGFELFPHKHKSQLTAAEAAVVSRAESYHGYDYNGGFCTLRHIRKEIRRLIPPGSNVFIDERNARVLERTFHFSQRVVTVWTAGLFTSEPRVVDSWTIVEELKQRYNCERASFQMAVNL